MTQFNFTLPTSTTGTNLNFPSTGTNYSTSTQTSTPQTIANAPRFTLPGQNYSAPVASSSISMPALGPANHTITSILASNTPPAYNTTTGQLTAYGQSKGLAQVNGGTSSNIQSNTSSNNNSSLSPDAQANAQGYAAIKDVNGNPTGQYADSNGNVIGGASALNTTPVNTTTNASQVSTSSGYTIPNNNNSATTQGTLSATTNGYMTTPQGFTKDANGNLIANPLSSNPSQSEILSRISSDNNFLATKGQANAELNTENGVDTKQQDYLDAYNNYNSKSVQYAQQQAAIFNQPGLTRDQATQNATETQRINNADLANLAIISQAAQGNYQAAMDIVQRKLTAEFQPVQDDITNLGQFINENNANLTDSQKVALSNQQFQLQTNFNAIISAKTAAHQFALQQGITDPNVLSNIDAATTVAGAYGAVGMSAPSSGSTSSDSTGVSNSQYSSYIKQTNDGTNYVSQDQLANLTPYQQQDAARQYAAAGIRVLPATDASAIQNIQTTKQNLNNLSTALIGTPDAKGNYSGGVLGSGAIGRIGSSISNAFGGATQSNPAITAIAGYRTLAINALQGLGAGQGARITQTEINNELQNIPTIYDSQQTALAKIKVLNSFLDNKSAQILPKSSSGSSSNSTSSGWF